MDEQLPGEPSAATAQLQSKEKKEAEPAKAAPSQPAPIPLSSSQTVQQPPMPSAVDFQKTRHSQYDAVIARMKQAERQTHGAYKPTL